MGRVAKPSSCPDCGRPTLRGLDGDRCALDVDVEPTPVDRRGELAAVVVGRSTYELARDGKLHRRTPRAVVHGPVDAAVIAHDCRWPPPPAQPFAPPAADLPDNPPF